MSGEIRNKVTMFISGQDPNLKFFPRIERVRDSFGNEATEEKSYVRTGLTLRVGDTIQFEAMGWDPEDSSLEWYYCISHGTTQLDVKVEGMTWEWEVSEKDVGVDVSLVVFLVSDRPYHKHGWHDGSVIFNYKVLPR